MVDGYASKGLTNKFIEKLQNENIHFRFFEPFFKNSNTYFGRRLHHKMVVVDGKYAVVGGMNIADRYNDLPESAAWLDYAVYIEGPISKELCILCWKTWNGYKRNITITECNESNNVIKIKDSEKAFCRFRRNDWVRQKNEISNTYKAILKNADKQITIMCSYFLPGTIVRKQLQYAIAKGTRIRLILAGKSDIKIAKAAERWMYDWLLRRNIEIYEYQPTILHAKMCVVDESFVTVGSYNINNISAYASIELNIDVKDKVFAQKITMLLDEIIKKDCIKVTTTLNKKKNNVFKQLYHWASYKIFRIGFFLFTFYFKQKE